MAVQAVTLTLKGKRNTKKEFKQLVEVGGKGVNGSVTRNEIIPALLKLWGVEYTSFNLDNFRYYLGGCVYTITIYNGESKQTGHVLLTKVMSSKIVSI